MEVQFEDPKYCGAEFRSECLFGQGDKSAHSFGKRTCPAAKSLPH
jgi:hypothetical protein